MSDNISKIDYSFRKERHYETVGTSSRCMRATGDFIRHLWRSGSIGQIEQENNASRMKELGVCETLEYGALEPGSLFEKISKLLNNGGFREKARKYSIMSKTMKGSQKASEIISGLSGRIQCY